MADELKMVPQGRAAQRNKKVSKGIFPGDFKNFVESKEFKESKKAQKDKLKKDSQHPVKGKHALMLNILQIKFFNFFNIIRFRNLCHE